MVMRVMLTGLLVIGTVSMLETNVNAAGESRRCCFECSKLCIQVFFDEKSEKVIAKAVAEVAAEVKQHEGSDVTLIGFTYRVGSSKEFDHVSRKTAAVREMLIQRGVPPDIIRSLILEGYAPVNSKRRGQVAIVTWPSGEKDKR